MRSSLYFPAALLISYTFAAPLMAQDAYDAASEEANPSSAALEVRISQLEEQMRRQQGTIEQLSYQNKQLQALLDKYHGDTDFRLSALEKAQTQAQAQPQPQTATAETTAPDDSNKLKPVESLPQSDGGSETDPVAAAPTASSPVALKFANAQDHYRYALKLLQQAKYQEAGDSFIQFTKRYPKDPLLGNAYYWLGDSYYVRRDYIKAADSFRQGYEAVPAGPKAADNLLKLAMSLDALSKDKEACVVLKQVVSKFGSSSSSIKSRGEQEINRIGCS